MLVATVGFLLTVPCAQSQEPTPPGGPVPTDDTKGIVVRLDVGSEPVDTPVVVHVKSTLGGTSDAQLKDDGVAPDVNAGDGMWSGSTFGVGDEYAVSISLGSRNIEGGSVSWAADDKQRDVTVTLRDGQLTANAGSSDVAGSSETPPPPGSAGGGGTPPNNGPPPQSAQPSGISPPPGLATSADDSTTLYVAFGMGAALLAVLAYLLYQRRGGSETELPENVVRLPELGIFGADTPALSAGLSIWTAAPADQHNLMRPLLATLARHHRVFVIAPRHSAIPAVRGGPVYRITEEDPRQISQAVDDVQSRGGPPLCILVVGEAWNGPRLNRLAALLPEGVGGVVVVTEAPAASLPILAWTRTGALWSMKYGDTGMTARETPDGLERTD